MEKHALASMIDSLIQRYGRLVFHTIYSFTGDYEESQDLTQDTFHQALKGLDDAINTTRGTFQPKAWLMKIALNTVRMTQRRKQLFRFIPFSYFSRRSPEKSLEDIFQEEGLRAQPGGFHRTDTGDPEERASERDLLHRTLQLLSEEHRAILVLSLVSEMSGPEIAQVLSLNVSTVRQRLSRARKQFHDLYLAGSGDALRRSEFDDALNKDRPQRRGISEAPASWSKGLA